MKVIGVAGPAGTGKSTVCRMLARRPGVAFVDCDALAWQSYRPGGPSYAPLIARFGEEILSDDGTVDRARLGDLVLGDPSARGDLEEIVHPAVMQYLQRTTAEHRSRGTAVLLVEGALLLSSPHVDRQAFDLFVWLYAPEEVRRGRLLSAGLEGTLVRRRMEAQADLAPPVDARVYPVDASGPPIHVADRIWSLVQTLQERRPFGQKHI